MSLVYTAIVLYKWQNNLWKMLSNTQFAPNLFLTMLPDLSLVGKGILLPFDAFHTLFLPPLLKLLMSNFQTLAAMQLSKISLNYNTAD